MLDLIQVKNSNTSKIQNQQQIKTILNFCLGFWPVPMVYYGVSSIYPALNFFPAVYLIVLAKLMILGFAILFHFLKLSFGKSFSILLAVGYGINQIIRSNSYITRKIINYPEAWMPILYKHWFYILLNFFLFIASYKAIRYLWDNCNYHEIFAFPKINFIQQAKGSWYGRFTLHITRLLSGTLGSIVLSTFKLVVKVRKWILSFWFVPVLYIFWFKQYFFLYPNSNLLQLFKYEQTMAVPLAILFTSLFLYKPCNLINRFGVILAALANIGAEAYGMFGYINYYANHFPVSWNKKNPIQTFTQIGNFIDNPNSWVFLFDFFFLGIGVFTIIKLLAFAFKAERKAKLSNKSTNYGTAKFLDLKGIRKINNREGIPIGAVPKVRSFKDPHEVVNNIKKHGGDDLIRIKSDHTTLVAPSRTGKGTGIIIPTLLEYPGPVFVTDVKGENYPVTKRAREAKGRKVIAFDPFGITNSPKIKINLLDFLNPDSIEVVDDSQTLASLICPVTQNETGNTKHFQEKSAAIIQCLLLYVTCSTTVDKSKKNLSEIYDILCLEDSALLNFFATTIGQDSSLAYGAAARLANTISSNTFVSEEQKNALSSARVAMRFIDTPHLREATNGSDIALADITKGDIDLFVCIPLDKLSTQYRLLRLITGITFIEMQKAQGRIGKYNLLMLLDEMPALGHMNQIEEMLVYGGGYGISLLVVSQTIEFLQSVYPNTWKTFFSNQLSIFFGCSEPMTAEFVAKKLGKKTIEVSSVNQSAGTQSSPKKLSGTSSSQSSDSLSETGRELLMPDEIERLGNRVVLAFNRGEYPIICHRIDYRERPEWVGLWDENPLHANRELDNQYSVKEYFGRIWQILIN